MSYKDDDDNQGQYQGVQLAPSPEHPTKKQAMESLHLLICVRPEYIKYHYDIVKRFIDQIKED